MIPAQYPMVDLNLQQCPSIVYRSIRPTDLQALERIHAALFPIRYESEFFLNVVNGHDIVSWAAVDISRPGKQSNELIGFVTARIVLAKESELDDIGQNEVSRIDQTLVYILTLGVIEHYRSLGIATSLVRQVIKYASSIPTCRAVYLHVIDYNEAAIHFYRKMLFKCVRRLSSFYYINGHHYDAYLFVYYVNGGRSPCSPLDLVSTFALYMRSLFTNLSARLWKNDVPTTRWTKCSESKKFILPAENDGSQCV